MYESEEEFEYDPMIPQQEGSGFFSDLASKAVGVLTSETTKQLGKKALEKGIEGVATKTGEKAVEAVSKRMGSKGKRKMEDIEEEGESEDEPKPKKKKFDKQRLIERRMQAEIEQAMKAERKRKKKKPKSSDDLVEDILSS